MRTGPGVDTVTGDQVRDTACCDPGHYNNDHNDSDNDNLSQTSAMSREQPEKQVRSEVCRWGVFLNSHHVSDVFFLPFLFESEETEDL